MDTLHLYTTRSGDILCAAMLLRAGRLVAFPTETVYGLGARADNRDAVALLYRVKKRPAEKKAAILVESLQGAMKHVHDLPKPALALAEKFWPGPLTLVVPDGKGDYIGLRCPDCAPLLEMISRAGVPVLAPSANISGEPPAADAEEVLESFNGMIAAVLDGGRCPAGRASTVIRVEGERAELLRKGPVTLARIRNALPCDAELSDAG